MDTTIAAAGDWHGNRRWALACVAALAQAGVREIYHLGDFGIWPGKRGRDYLLALEAALRERDMTIFVTPGNHEDYSQIGELPALDLGRDVGEVQWVTDRIALLPRGHRWERDGWTFVSLGGAPSVDRGSRTEGVDWWPEEMITQADVARVVAGGPADVMLAHDAPHAEYGTPAVAQILDGNPLGWPADALRYAAQGRDRLTEAFLAVRPRLFLHGHYHLQSQSSSRRFGHTTRVLSVGLDGGDGNLVLVSLPGRASGRDPQVSWLDLPGR